MIAIHTRFLPATDRHGPRVKALTTLQSCEILLHYFKFYFLTGIKIMKTTVFLCDFREAFARAGRQSQFSYDGLAILFDYLEEIEQDTGEEIELDVIALCCDFAESTIQELIDQYSIDVTDCDPDDDDEIRQAVYDYLSDNTMVCGETDEGFVYQQF